MIPGSLNTAIIAGAGGVAAQDYTVLKQNLFDDSTANSGTFDKYAQRMFIQIAADCTRLRIPLKNFYIDATTPVANGNAVTIDAMALDDNISQTYQFTFDSGASTSKVLAGGATEIYTDYINASQFGLTKFTRGQILGLKWIPSVANVGVDNILFNATGRAKQTGEQILRYNSISATVSNILTFGNFTVLTGTGSNTATSFYMIPAVVGTLVNSADADKTWLVTGDSLPTGVNDGVSSNTIYGRGYVLRALAQTDQSLPYPSISLVKGGAFLTTFTAAGVDMIKPYIKFAKNAFLMAGTNDIGINAGGGITLSYLQGRFNPYADLLLNNGISDIYTSGMFPRTNGVFTAEATQNINIGWAAGEVAEQYSNWLQSGAGGKSAGHFNPRPPLLAVDPYKWPANGTGDGTHYQPPQAILVADALRAQIAIWTP